MLKHIFKFNTFKFYFKKKNLKNRSHKILESFIKPFKATPPICKAPWVSISIGMDGTISPCCYTINYDRNNEKAKWGKYAIKEIWESEIFQIYRKSIKSGLLPDACSICRDKIARKEFSSLKTQEFVRFNHKTKTPLIIELSVDNTCNLECIMCNSINSSKIASIKNSGFKGINNYERLFIELKEYIPKLEEMIFTGGEPFLSKFYFRLWNEIIETNPNCKITLNTNCTVLSKEAKEIIEKANFSFNVSIDSFNKKTYESIRKNADFETTLNNFKYLVNYSARKEVPLAVAVCPLKQNYKDIPELINICNQYGAFVHFVHVFGAQNSALSNAGVNTLNLALRILENNTPLSETETEQLNLQEYNSLIEDIKQWKENNTIIETKLSEINTQEENDKYINDLINIKTKLNKKQQEQLENAINCLPENYKNGVLIDVINSLPQSTLSDYLEILPSDEIAEYLGELLRSNILNLKLQITNIN